MQPLKYILLHLLISLISYTAFSQKQTFDVLTYAQPAGWEKSENAGAVTFSRQKGNDFCMVTFYKSVTANNDPRKNFDLSWQSLIRKILNTGAATMQPDNSENGWSIKTGVAPFDKDGTKGIAMLITGTAGNLLVNIVCLFNTDAFQKEMEAFLATVAPQKQTPETKVAAAPVSEKGNGNNIRYSVWMCHCYTTTENIGEKKFKTVILSPDGRGLYHMPEKGLNGVTPENSNDNGSWGTVTDNGSSLQLRNKQYGNMDLYKISPTSMSRYPNSKSSVYYKVKQVDGLRLEGAYSPELSYYNGKTDIISRQIDPNKRPVIFFKKDGTYINEGLEFSNLTYGDNFALGKGTYEIKNYSIILTTVSGRTLQMAFTPVLNDNSAGSNDGYIINNQLFYRLGSQFVPNK